MSEYNISGGVLVGVLCYNHERYLAQCLDSILCQKCQFPFMVYVFDDVSTDNSWNIIQEYKQRYNTQMVIEQPEYNNYSAGNRNAFLQHVKKVNRAEYVAFCEADDYWTDEYKLQKQYNAMQKSRKAAMCIHDVELVDENNGHCAGIVPGFVDAKWPQRELVTRILMYSISFRINGVFIRSEVFNNIDMYTDYWNYWATDLALFVYILLSGDMIHLNDNMATKRVNNIGSLSYHANLDIICQEQIKVFEADIRWIRLFGEMSGEGYNDLIEYYTLFRMIRLYYLYKGDVKKNKYVSNGNGKMYLSEVKRKINQNYIKIIKRFYKEDECRFVKHSRRWMEKEWKRLQTME